MDFEIDASDYSIEHNYTPRIDGRRSRPRKRNAKIPNLESSYGKTIVESPRKRVRRTDEIEMVSNRKPRARKKSTTKVQYENPVKSFFSNFNIIKLGWLVCALLLCRLAFMDRGVIDYYSMKDSIVDKQYDLEMLKKENIALEAEIKRIKYDKSYQKFLAREHLGVIAADEYLVLFARD